MEGLVQMMAGLGLVLLVLVMIHHGISQGFGKGAGFTVGLILLNPIFLLILAFGSAQYVGQGGGGEALASEPEPEPGSSELEQV